MVCKLPSARSLSKARSEGALRENMANADMSASVKEMSPSSQRESGMVAKTLRTKRKSASAERCVRALGATMDMGHPITRTSHRSSQGVFSHRCLRKASAANTVITGLEGSAGIAAFDSDFWNTGWIESSTHWKEWPPVTSSAAARIQEHFSRNGRGFHWEVG